MIRFFNYVDPHFQRFPQACWPTTRDCCACGKIRLNAGYAMQNGAMIGGGHLLPFKEKNKNNLNYETKYLQGGPWALLAHCEVNEP